MIFKYLSGILTIFVLASCGKQNKPCLIPTNCTSNASKDSFAINNSNVILENTENKLNDLEQIEDISDRLFINDEDRARLSDIPFIIGSKPWYLSNNNLNNQIIIQYNTQLSYDSIIDFYKTQMDYFGWQERGSFIAQESCLIFKKPTKQSIILIRSNNINNIIKEYNPGYIITLFIDMSNTKKGAFFN